MSMSNRKLIKNVHPCTFFILEFCLSKTLEVETTAIRGGTEMTFANRRGRYKAQTKNTRRRAFCTSRTVFCEVTQ